MITLYQFPISHYCEKIRWALDHKNLDYRISNLLPGFHVSTIKKMAAKSTVPVIQHDQTVIQNSSDIITYLDREFPNQPLTPSDDALSKEAKEWEDFADQDIGVHMRRVCYHTMLDHPDLIIPFFTTNGPWYGRFIVPIIFSKLRERIRAYLDINDRTTKNSVCALSLAIDKVYERLQNRLFLVGDQFSRADLAVAALLAPFCRPDKYGISWPAHFPEPLQTTIEACEGKLDWVSKVYIEYR